MPDGILVKNDTQESVNIKQSVACTANAWAKCYEYTPPVDGYYGLWCRARWSQSFPIGANITHYDTAPTGYDDLAVSPSGINEVSATLFLQGNKKIYFYGMWQQNGTNDFEISIKLIS